MYKLGRVKYDRLIGLTQIKRCYTQEKATSNSEYCVDLVKTSDYESYLCGLLYPKEIIRSAFAIRAFNVEMANVGVSARDPRLCEGRFKFWRLRLDMIFNKTEKKNMSTEPITSELDLAVGRHKLSKHWLLRLIESREEQVKARYSFLSVKDVEKFGEMSTSSVYYLLLECMNVKNVNCDHAASHLGKSQILVNLVRSIPSQAKTKTCHLPIDLLVKHKVSQNDIIKANMTEGFKDLVYELCNLSNQHLVKARNLAKQVPENTYILFINSIIIESFLKNIENYNFDIFNPKLHARDPFISWKLSMAKLKNKY